MCNIHTLWVWYFFQREWKMSHSLISQRWRKHTAHIIRYQSQAYQRQRLPNATSQALFSCVWYVFLISLSLRIFSSARVRNISLTGFCSGMSVFAHDIISHLNALFCYNQNNTHHICTDAILSTWQLHINKQRFWLFNELFIYFQSLFKERL